MHAKDKCGTFCFSCVLTTFDNLHGIYCAMNVTYKWLETLSSAPKIPFIPEQHRGVWLKYGTIRTFEPGSTYHRV